MKRIAMLFAFATLATLATLVAAGSATAADDSRTIAGAYVWDQGDTGGAVEAVFTPTGEGTWDVAFHFNFDGEDHVYTGTAKGNLMDGALAGEVKADKRPVTFKFEGTFEDGKFSGTHAQVREDGETKTGTLSLGE